MLSAARGPVVRAREVQQMQVQEPQVQEPQVQAELRRQLGFSQSLSWDRPASPGP